MLSQRMLYAYSKVSTGAGQEVERPNEYSATTLCFAIRNISIFHAFHGIISSVTIVFTAFDATE